VVSALLRRVPLRLPATGFGFRGSGVSYQTASAAPLAGFRGDDVVTIRSIADEPDFHHTDGSPRSPGDSLSVSLDEGDWVAYEVNLAAPTRLTVRVGLAESAAVAIAVDDEELAVGDNVVVATTARVVRAGRHAVRVTSRSQRAVFDWLEVTPIS